MAHTLHEQPSVDEIMSHFSRTGEYRRPPITMATYLGASKMESERDSGFSDASSEYLSAVDLTDSEYTGRTVSVLGQDQTARVGGSYTGLSPMIIMNNFVLKQPSSMAPVEKQLGFPSSLEVMPQSQVVLLQPMVSNNNLGSVKTTPENDRESRSYLPILKSYPRIAPHPGERPGKRQGSSAARGSAVPGHDQRQQRQHHGQRPYDSPRRQAPAKNTPGFAAPGAFCRPRPSGSPPPLETDGGSVASDPHDLASFLGGDSSHQTPDNKLKRFSNTYNILNKSGLLGITLRTKQLIKENRRTQVELRWLQEQTALLMEALGTGDPQLWTKLQLALRDQASPPAEEEPPDGDLLSVSV